MTEKSTKMRSAKPFSSSCSRVRSRSARPSWQPSRRNQIAHARDRLASAADVRERADGPARRRVRPRLLRARSRELVKLDEVAGVIGGKHARLPCLAGAASREQGAQHAHCGDRDAEVPHPDLLERLGEQGDYLGVCGRASLADELDAPPASSRALPLVDGLLPRGRRVLDSGSGKAPAALRGALRTCARSAASRRGAARAGRRASRKA